MRQLTPRSHVAAVLVLFSFQAIGLGGPIDLGDVTAGGDGSGNAPPANTGVDPRTGGFTTDYLDGPITETAAGGDGLNPSPVAASPYVDAVFFIAPGLPGTGAVSQVITMSGVRFDAFRPSDGLGNGWNYVLRNRNGGVSTPGVQVGGVAIPGDYAVGIHAAMGITYDLDALRARHGDDSVGCFTAFWGLDGCDLGDVNLYAILASDAGVIAGGWRRFRALGSVGEWAQMEIPAAARYLTLATGTNNGGTCGHGTFGYARITCSPCPAPSFTALESVAPRIVSTAGGTEVTFTGRDLGPGHLYLLGGQPVTGVVPVDALGTRVRGFSPALPAGAHGAEVRLPTGGLVACFKDAVQAVPAPRITAVEPRDVSRDGTTAVAVRGAGFSAGTTIRIGARELSGPHFVSPDLITGSAPALGAGEADGPRDVTVEGPLGMAVLTAGVSYFTPISVTLERVTPSLVSTAGGTAIEVTGSGFAAGMAVRLGGMPIAGAVLVNPTTIRGQSPALPAGVHAAEVGGAAGAVLAHLEGAVEARRPVALVAVEPRAVLLDGTTRVSIRGADFRGTTRIRIGDHALVEPVLVSPALITGLAPALDDGEFEGSRDVIAVDPLGNAMLPGGVTYLPPLPGPQEVEASLAEGTARFSWYNPVPYDTIRVLDLQGNLLGELPGHLTSLELDAGQQSQVAIQLEGVSGDGRFASADAFAAVIACPRPPYLTGKDIPGDLEFSVYGGSSSQAPADRCGGGGGGGGGDAGPAGGGGGFFAQPLNSIGLVTTLKDRVDFALNVQTLSNTLTTGFELLEDADRLEIGAFYQKIAAEPGVSLRGRLRHIYPADGFEDEFTFPDTVIEDKKGWHSLTYFRSDRDVGTPVTEQDPAPQPCNGMPKVPKGEYLLDIYSVDGDGFTPYYVFQDDGRDNELLIPGSPCPPYPRVKVADLTGYYSFPTLSFDEPKSYKNGGKIFAEFKVRGTWFDKQNVQHSIDPTDESYIQHPFEFIWRVLPAGQATSSKTANKITFEIPTFSCYRIEVTVRDKGCALESMERVFTRELAVTPQDIACGNGLLGFSNPSPDLSKFYAIAGLKPPPGQGTFTGKRPLELTFIVAPACCDSGKDPESCPAATRNDFALRLSRNGVSVRDIKPEEIDDLCQSKQTGVKYFRFRIADLGTIPSIPDNDGSIFSNVNVEQKTLRVRAQNGNPSPVNDTWHALGPPLKMSNAPPALAHSYWRGNFEERTQSYRFAFRTSRGTVENFAMGQSAEVQIPLPGKKVMLERQNNEVKNQLKGTMKAEGGEWFAEQADGGMSGEMMGNQLDGAPMLMKEAAKIVNEKARYEWKKSQVLVDNEFEQPLFDGILYTGTIGPIPITIRGSVGIGFAIQVGASVTITVSPFAPTVDGGPFIENEFCLGSNITVSVPCSLRADVLFGVASLVIGIEPAIQSSFSSILRMKDLVPEAGIVLEILLSLTLKAQMCHFIVLCFPELKIPLLDDVELVKATIPNGFEGSACEFEEDDEEEEGGGGGLDLPQFSFQETSAPITATSPDGQTTLDSWIGSDGVGLVFMNAQSVFPGDPKLAFGRFRDPAAGFLDNSTALMAWTASFPDESGVAKPWDDSLSLDERNLLQAQEEVVVTRIEYQSGQWKDTLRVRLADLENSDAASRRSDGRAAMAVDLTREEATVVWVRYETQEMLKAEEDETTTIYERQMVNGKEEFVEVAVPTIRPQLEKTAIYARRLDAGGPSSSGVKLSPAGINIEPVIAFSPTGNVAYCVWVHDPTHRDLLTTNRGRTILYSVHDRDNDLWGSPQSAVAMPDDFPGMLEPSIALRGDGQGLLAFTALDKSAPSSDTGLGGAGRSVYVSRLTSGVFAPPVLIHGKCGRRIYGRWVTTKVPTPVSFDPFSDLLVVQPDLLVSFQSTGVTGSREGSGNVVVSVLGQGQEAFTPPQKLFPEGNVRSNSATGFADGTLRAITLNGGLADLSSGLGGGGQASTPFFEAINVALRHDLTVAACQLDDPFAGPGVTLHARVAVENQGLAGTPQNAGGQSVVGLRAIYVADDGSERVVDETPLPQIPAGAHHVVVFTLEMPHDPVGLRVEVFPNPLDARPENDARTCFLGSPAPRDVACTAVTAADEGGTLLPRLTWQNAALYDEVLIYRDGSMIAALPGDTESYVDLSRSPPVIPLVAGAGGLASFQHVYAVRSRTGPSRSRRVESAGCGVSLPPPDIFRRGDSNDDGKVNIADPIHVLNFLFRGGPTPRCQKAADADDSGSLNITDPIFLLGYLFSGGRPPPAPFPACGVDSTGDAISCATQPRCP